MTDATLHCIGSWRDGSANFLYGTFRGLDLALHGNSKDEDTYRCFVSKQNKRNFEYQYNHFFVYIKKIAVRMCSVTKSMMVLLPWQ